MWPKFVLCSHNDFALFFTLYVSLTFILSSAVYHRPVAAAVSKFPKVLVISMDAFKPDYVEDCLTPTIIKLRASGVYAPFLKNVFPTKTLPNHHSIATGVFPNVHGVLDSTVHISKDPFITGYSSELYQYNNDILPIWSLNQLAGKGRHSGVMMWPGGEFSYGCKKTKPTFVQKLDMNITFRNRVDSVVSWFSHEQTPANLVMLYFEDPDLHAHAFGIDSSQIREQIKRLDKTLEYLGEQLKKHGLDGLITVFVLSDHGMINLSQSNIIDLNKYVDNSTYVVAGNSPVLQIFPNEGKENEVLSGLQRAHQDFSNKLYVYTRKDIPSMWNYADNNRTPPILVVAQEGYAFQDFYGTMHSANKVFNITPNPNNKYGIHGYSNTLSSMYPLFFAWGPMVKSGVVLDPFNTTELYPLWAYILNLDLEHEVYSSPNFSLLRLSPDSLEPSAHMPSNVTIQAPLNSNSSKDPSLPTSGAPLWAYWVSGLIAVTLLIIITGVVVHFCRDLYYGKNVQIIVPQGQRNFVENQHLLLSDSEDEFKI